MPTKTRPWREIRRDVGDAQLPTEEGRDEGLGLGELRAAVSMTQVELAQRMGVDQPRISRLERQGDVYLSTLRDYVRGLGGELELLARFADDRVIWIEPPVGEQPTDVATSLGADLVTHDRRGHVTATQVKGAAHNRNVNRNAMRPPER